MKKNRRVPDDSCNRPKVVERHCPRPLLALDQTELADHMKLGVARPGLLVDVSRLPLKTVDEQADGRVRVCAVVRNSELAADH